MKTFFSAVAVVAAVLVSQAANAEPNDFHNYTSQTKAAQAQAADAANVAPKRDRMPVSLDRNMPQIERDLLPAPKGTGSRWTGNDNEG